MSDLILPDGYQHSESKEPKQRITRADGEIVKTREEIDALNPTQNDSSNDDVDPIEDLVELFPSEVDELNRRFSNIQKRFIGKMGASELGAYVDALENELAKMGLDGSVVALNPIRHVSGNVALAPELEIRGRVEKQFDHDQMSWEVQHGLSDGVEGVMTYDGMKAPKKVF